MHPHAWVWLVLHQPLPGTPGCPEPVATPASCSPRALGSLLLCPWAPLMRRMGMAGTSEQTLGTGTRQLRAAGDPRPSPTPSTRLLASLLSQVSCQAEPCVPCCGGASEMVPWVDASICCVWGRTSKSLRRSTEQAAGLSLCPLGVCQGQQCPAQPPFLLLLFLPRVPQLLQSCRQRCWVTAGIGLTQGPGLPCVAHLGLTSTRGPWLWASAAVPICHLVPMHPSPRAGAALGLGAWQVTLQLCVPRLPWCRQGSATGTLERQQWLRRERVALCCRGFRYLPASSPRRWHCQGHLPWPARGLTRSTLAGGGM